MDIINGRTVRSDRDTNLIQHCRVSNLGGIYNLSRVGLHLDGQHTAHLSLVDLNLVRNEISNLTLASCAALFLFPYQMGNGVDGQSGINLTGNLTPSCSDIKADSAVLLEHLVDDRDHVIQFDLSRLAALLEVICVSDDEGNLALAHAQTQCQFNSIDHRHTLPHQNVRLALDVIVILIAVVDVVLLDDLVDGHHLLFIEVDIENTLVIDSGILSDPSALVVQLVLLPHSRSIAIEHIAVMPTLLLELSVLEVLRRVVDSVQIVMDNRHFVLNNGLDEVLLNRLYIAQLCTFPLVAIVEPIVSVGVYIDASLPMVVPAFLIQSPNRCFLNLTNIHLLTSPAHLPDLCLCRQNTQYYA